METELEKNFSLASRWGCILLLDESDVFLAQRERKDFKRNGLVAVFLRVLEYYAGILFLTTNRVGDFDEAFASRIHMSLFYPELDWEKTKSAFELNLDVIKKRCAGQGRRLIFDDSSILRFAKDHYDTRVRALERPADPERLPDSPCSGRIRGTGHVHQHRRRGRAGRFSAAQAL